MSLRYAFFAATAAASLLAAGAANASLIVNGGFADGLIPASGGFQTVGVSSGVIPGWNVTAGNVDWIRGYWQSSDGDGYSIDMNGDTQGTIAQTISTVAGKTYHLTFDMSGNPDAGSDTRNIRVDTGGASTLFSYVFTTGASPLNNSSNMNWAHKALTFTATGASTQIRFASGDFGRCCWGAALDNVAVSSAVPEPTSWALMMSGFFGAGAILRRTRRQVAAA